MFIALPTFEDHRKGLSKRGTSASRDDVEPAVVFAFGGEWSGRCIPDCPQIVQGELGAAASS